MKSLLSTDVFVNKTKRCFDSTCNVGVSVQNYVSNNFHVSLNPIYTTHSNVNICTLSHLGFADPSEAFDSICSTDFHTEMANFFRHIIHFDFDLNFYLMFYMGLDIMQRGGFYYMGS